MSITKKGQVVIPKELRNKYGIEANSQVIVTEINDHIVVLPLTQDPLREGRGLLKFIHPVADIVREQRNEEKAGEERRRALRRGTLDRRSRK